VSTESLSFIKRGIVRIAFPSQIDFPVVARFVDLDSQPRQFWILVALRDEVGHYVTLRRHLAAHRDSKVAHWATISLVVCGEHKPAILSDDAITRSVVFHPYRNSTAFQGLAINLDLPRNRYQFGA